MLMAGQTPGFTVHLVYYAIIVHAVVRVSIAKKGIAPMAVRQWQRQFTL